MTADSLGNGGGRPNHGRAAAMLGASELTRWEGPEGPGSAEKSSPASCAPITY